MVTDNSSKVLTVSYGTFSCTLEGFENSFDMMTTVAEYFRDLAAEDRFFGAEPPKLDAEILGILEQRGKQLGINTRQSGDTSIVLTPSQFYDEETSEEASAPVTEPTTSVSSPALSIDERLDRIKAVTTAATVPAVYTEDEHANDVATDHGETAEETSAGADMAAPSEETAELVGELPKIVDHIEFEDAPEDITPGEDVVGQPEVSAEDETQETAVVEEIVDHPEIDPAPIADEAVEEDADKVDEHHDATVAEMHWPICVPPWLQPSLTNHWAKMTRTAQRPIAMIWPRPCARAAQNHRVRANLHRFDWSQNNALMNPLPRRPRLRYLRPRQSQKWPSMIQMKHRPNL
jgi:pilus assembly protein FimV